MQTLVNTVRATGATNIIALGGLQFSNALSQWLANKPTDPTGNLAAAWHSYNFNICSNTSCWNTNVAPVIAQVPLLVGEIGENDCAHGYIDGLMNFLDAHSTGYLGWAWNANFNCNSGPALISNYNGTPTNFGIGLRDHLAAINSGATPTSTPTRTSTATPTRTPTRTPTPPAIGTHLDNPFVGATGYVNPSWRTSVLNAAQATTDPTLAAKMRAIANTSTAVWMDRRAAISGADGGLGLTGHLDAALAQKQGATPETIIIVVYDLPGRDCNALASNGELPATAAGLATYKTEYIDPIAATFAQTKYASLRIIAIIEPDSLPNITTNSGVAACQTAAPFYEQGVAYALDKLHAISNVYTYVDAAHAGWLGWPNNSSGAVQEFAKVANMTIAKFQSIDGFITDTANTTPLKEPFFQGSTNVGGTPVMNSSFYEFNPDVDEASYTADMYLRLVQGGFPSSIGMLIDTSRNGWGGGQRPTAASTSTSVETFVTQSKVDHRPHRGAWCNQNGAGIGERPVATPPGFPSSHIDGFVWVKPPGESDGASQPVDNNEGKGFDRMCDPTFVAPALGGRLTNALPNAPLAGHWFPAQFTQLVQNAFPAIQP